MATHEAHRAESKYDTFSLESSYLARGQSMRIAELTRALQRFQALPLTELKGEDTPICLGTLIRLETPDGEKRTLFFGPAAGGEKIDAEGEEVVMITACAPLGQALLGKTKGNTFEFKMGKTTHAFKVVSVE